MTWQTDPDFMTFLDTLPEGSPLGNLDLERMYEGWKARPVWVAYAHTESGDRYLLGPFSHKPTPDECHTMFRSFCEEEADYMEEICGGTDYFRVVHLQGDVKFIG